MRKSIAFYKSLIPTYSKNQIDNYIQFGKIDSRSDKANRGYIWDCCKEAIKKEIMRIWAEGLLTISEAEKLVDIYEKEIERRFTTV